MTTTTVPTPDEIWAILERTAAAQEETAAAHEKGRQEMAEFRASQKEIAAIEDARRKEAAAIEDARHEKAMQEIAEIAARQAADHEELMQEMKETDRRMKETDKQIKKNEASFNSRWGRLVESLVEGDLVAMLQEKGVHVYQIYRNISQSGSDDNFEYDIIAANGQEIVVVEVKTTLKAQDVKDFLVSMSKVTTRMPRFKDNTVYGAIAWLKSDEQAHVYAEKQGLFVIRATGNSASIINKDNFKPQIFS